VLALPALTAEEVLGDDPSGQFALLKSIFSLHRINKDANSNKKLFMSICFFEA
jgi:hypothetical protein